MITLAMAKGRMLGETLPLLESAGITPAENPETSRKLILPTNVKHLRLVLVRAADVITYVQYGAADLGVTGKDLLMEHGGDDVYELLDLGVSRCRMVVAGPQVQSTSINDRQADQGLPGGRVRVATKYVNVSRAHFANRGRQAEVIKLYGSMELAPLAGLADCIVDLVDSGATLKANGLFELDQIADISARLIANRGSMKIYHGSISAFAAALDSGHAYHGD